MGPIEEDKVMVVQSGQVVSSPGCATWPVASRGRYWLRLLNQRRPGGPYEVSVASLHPELAIGSVAELTEKYRGELQRWVDSLQRQPAYQAGREADQAFLAAHDGKLLYESLPEYEAYARLYLDGLCERNSLSRGQAEMLVELVHYFMRAPVPLTQEVVGKLFLLFNQYLFARPLSPGG
jgi:hypothetical protein